MTTPRAYVIACPAVGAGQSEFVGSSLLVREHAETTAGMLAGQGDRDRWYARAATPQERRTRRWDERYL